MKFRIQNSEFRIDLALWCAAAGVRHRRAECSAACRSDPDAARSRVQRRVRRRLVCRAATRWSSASRSTSIFGRAAAAVSRERRGGDVPRADQPRRRRVPAENVHFLKGPQATLADDPPRARRVAAVGGAAGRPRRRVLRGPRLRAETAKGISRRGTSTRTTSRRPAYPMSTLGDVLANRVKAGWKVLLTDACHSGKINPATTNEALERSSRRCRRTSSR